MTQGGVRTPGKATPPHLCDFAMERPPPLPPGAVAVVDDFLHGALHVILHARRVFPPDVFERRRLFDVAARGTSSSTSTSPESSSAPAICWSAASSTHSSSVLAPPARTARPAVLERFRIDVRLPAAGSLSVHADALHASAASCSGCTSATRCSRRCPREQSSASRPSCTRARPVHRSRCQRRCARRGQRQTRAPGRTAAARLRPARWPVRVAPSRSSCR